MKSFGCGTALCKLPSALVIVGAVLLLAACGGSDGGRLDDAMEPEIPMTEVPETPMTELGAWNAPMAGSVDVRDANGVLRAHYDSAGTGRIVADAPVQPAITGTATWTGMWSGNIELNENPAAAAGLRALGANLAAFERLEGGALVTAVLDGDSVMATLTYQDIGLEDLGVTEISSDPTLVTAGRFVPENIEILSFDAETPENPIDPTSPTTTISATITGDFTGEGVFGGADAAGVVGYVGGEIHFEYFRGTEYLGTLQSVFYGARDQN